MFTSGTGDAGRIDPGHGHPWGIVIQVDPLNHPKNRSIPAA